jgi:acetyl esterase/lipase
MTSRHLVDPETLPILDMFPALEFSEATLAEIRAQLFAIEPIADPEIDVVERHVPGPPGAPDVRVLCFTPNGLAGPLPAYLHIHGGGYVIGMPEMSGPDSMRLAKALGCMVVSVDYRLAPETPAPGAVEDCYAALEWLHGNAGDLAVDAARIAIGGESAGGGLAAALALLTRDRGRIPLVFQLLIYPMLDDRTGTAGEPHPFAGEFIWTADSNRFGWTSLLGHAPAAEAVSPYAAPARARSLAGLPPTFISVGALDLFIEENLDYARRLIRDGVPTELHVYPGGIHGFNMAAEADVTRRFLRDQIDALRRALHPPR